MSAFGYITNVAPPQRLQIQDTVIAAYAVAWDHKWSFIKLAVLPILAPLSLDFLLKLLGEAILAVDMHRSIMVYVLAELLSSMVRAIALTAFAVPWLRLCLRRDDKQGALAVLRWRRRHLRFLMAVIVLGGVGEILWYGTYLSMGKVLVDAMNDLANAAHPYQHLALQSFGGVSTAVLMTGIILLVSRWGVTFPAVADDYPLSFRHAWRVSAGNGLRLAVVVIMAALPTHIGATFMFEGFPWWRPFPGFNWISETVADFMALGLGASALAAAYRTFCPENQRS